MTALSHRLTDIVSQQKGFHISSDPLSRRSDTASITFSKLSFKDGHIVVANNSRWRHITHICINFTLFTKSQFDDLHFFVKSILIASMVSVFPNRYYRELEFEKRFGNFQIRF